MEKSSKEWWAEKPARRGQAVWGCRVWPTHCPRFSCSYIWQHIEIGYVQGMCDLLAPLLVILDDGECVLPSL